MPLTAAQVKQARAELVNDLYRTTIPCGFTKTELESALTAADAWADTNAASYNAALPQPFRNQATTQEKAALLAFVCLRRFRG